LIFQHLNLRDNNTIEKLSCSSFTHYHYYRTQAVFSIIAMVIMIISNTFAFYTFRHHRYMYKRLTAGLCMIVAMCIFVTIETISHSVNNWKAMSKENHPLVYGNYLRCMSFGYSTILAWMVFVIYLSASIVFILAGRKQKGDHAAALEFEVEDRPFILGR
ncbi:unnamed protein product, partial [Soboliphyme baturini]|uniref:G_PROTEIN_RECEP_F2_4 domain-containing protein n=1 Tax=Soboliphyme baturini TaxID=241478 RepID=A0A183IY75_9BILA